jgi:phosphatidylglycerol lysyltransferase
MIARDIVMRFGHNATAYQILNPGVEHWFMPGEPAVVGFVRQGGGGGTWVVAGEPVCELKLLPRTVTAFEREAARHEATVCYLCAASRLHTLLAPSRNYATIAIGAEPVWNPVEWPNVVATHPGIRSQLRRAARKNIRIDRWKTPTPSQFAQLRHTLAAWLVSRPLPPLHFLIGTDALGAGVADRLLLVAHQDDALIAFLLASPIPHRRGYLVEQIIRRPDAPNGTAELLIDAAMRAMAAEGCTHATLGLVALADHAAEQMQRNPAWLRLVMSWARAHGRRFYHFDGLELFRNKLAPSHWETLYAISTETDFSPATLYAIAAAFTEGRPLPFIASACAGALKREATWLLHPLRQKKASFALPR